MCYVTYFVMQPRLEKEVQVQGGAEVAGMDSREEVDLQRQRQRLSGDTRVIAQEQTALSYVSRFSSFLPGFMNVFFLLVPKGLVHCQGKVGNFNK